MKNAKKDFIEDIVGARYSHTMGLYDIEKASEVIEDIKTISGYFGVTVALLASGVAPCDLQGVADSVGRILVGWPRSPQVEVLTPKVSPVSVVPVPERECAEEQEAFRKIVTGLANADLYGEEFTPTDFEDAVQFSNHYIREARLALKGEGAAAEPSLKESALSLSKQKEHVRTQVERLIDSKEVPSEPSAGFWALVSDLVKEIASAYRSYGEHVAVRYGCGNFLRSCAFHRKGVDRLSLDDIATFIREYEALTESYYRALSHDDYARRGDDGWSDLLDALPLAGQGAYARLVRGIAADEGELKDSVEAGFDCYSLGAESLTPFFSEVVLHGENYVRMRLVDSLMEILPSLVRE